MERKATERTWRVARRANLGLRRCSHSSHLSDKSMGATVTGEEVAVEVQGEDVFVHQLHRRASLLN